MFTGGNVLEEFAQRRANRELTALLARQAEGFAAVGQLVKATGFCLFARKPARHDRPALAVEVTP